MKRKVPNKEKGDDNRQLSQGTPAATLSEELRPTELLEKCKTDQHKWTTVNLEKVKLFFAGEYLLSGVVLPPAPEDVDKYEHLLKVLREAVNKQVRLTLLAKWLKQENICAPQDILGADIFKKVAKE